MSNDTRETLAAAEVGLANLLSYQSSAKKPSLSEYGQARRALDAVRAALTEQPEAPEPAAPAQERAQAEPTCLHSAATILTVAADAVIRAYRAKYRNTSRGGFNARAPLYAEIADLNAALVGMGGLDNRGELLRHAAPAAPAQEPQPSDEYDHEKFDAIAAARYRVVPANSGFWGYAVEVGDSTAQVYKGHKRDCELVARRMAGAFLDGAFLASQRAAAPAQEPQQPTPDVGAMEYRGNTVSFMYDRAKVYGEEIMRVWYVLKEVGRHPGRTDDPLHEVVRRALSAAPSPAPAAQELQQPDVPVKQAAVLMKLIRAAWKGDPEIAEAYGNLLAERMDADGFTGRCVRDTLAILRGERQEVLIHPAAAPSPAPMADRARCDRSCIVTGDCSGNCINPLAGQPQGGSNG